MILSNPFIVDPRVYKEATSLVEAGHEVKAIVRNPKHKEIEHANLNLSVVQGDVLNPQWS